MATMQLEDRDRPLNLGRSLYRATSPATARLEARVKELEDHLDEERSLRIKVERELAELNSEFDVLNADYRELNDQVAQHEDAVRRREQDFVRVRRELDGLREAHEENLNSIKRRHQTALSEQTAEIGSLQRAKTKAEKERSDMARQLENAFTEMEDANKSKALAQAKMESLEAQTIRLRANYEEAQKKITELNAQNVQLMADATEQARTIEKLNTSLANAQRGQNVAEGVAEDHKKALEEETKIRTMLQNKLNSIQQEFEIQIHRAEEEAELASKLQSQLTKVTTEMGQIRSKYDRELNEKSEEFDELKRRLNSRINELTESYELEHSRVVSLERTKNQLTNQIQEIQTQLDTVFAECSEHAQMVKTLEGQKSELENLLEESQTEESNLRTKSGLMQRELIQLRAVRSELEERLGTMEKEAKQNAEKLKETKERLSSMNRQVTELESSRARLEAEREHLDNALKDTEDALHECETKYQTAHSALSAMRAEIERQSRDKDEEMESIRRSSQRNIENLKAAIADMETKHVNEVDRLKKKLETSISSLESQLEEERAAHSDLIKANEDAEAHIVQLESELNEVNALASETASTLQICESRRLALSNEVESLQSQIEITDRLKKKLEEESADTMAKIGNLTMQVNNLTNDRRKLEGQITVLQGDLDDANGAREVACERADRLQAEVTKLAQELQTEQESSRRADAARRHLEAELKDSNAKILESRRAADQAEREADEARNQAELKVRELQLALEEESRRTRETQNQLRKCERSLKESTQAEEDAARMINELRDMVERAQTKLKQTRRQLEDAESAAQAAMMKYRKAQQQVDDADLRVQMAERRLGIGSNDDNASNYGTLGRQRAGSVYPSRARGISITREGSVYSVMSEAPAAPYKSRFQSGPSKSGRRFESSSLHPRDTGSVLSLMDLPPAETNGL